MRFAVPSLGFAARVEALRRFQEKFPFRTHKIASVVLPSSKKGP
jgi:hypothetical protein